MVPPLAPACCSDTGGDAGGGAPAAADTAHKRAASAAAIPTVGKGVFIASRALRTASLGSSWTWNGPAIRRTAAACRRPAWTQTDAHRRSPGYGVPGTGGSGLLDARACILDSKTLSDVVTTAGQAVISAWWSYGNANPGIETAREGPKGSREAFPNPPKGPKTPGKGPEAAVSGIRILPGEPPAWPPTPR